MVDAFAEALPEIHARLVLDAEAICAGDPAAESVDEVIAAYPGFLAIAIHRIAHAIHHLGVPIVPRLLAEVAHTRTGIDIHPGASIGRGFCIDHGTGVVVGETAVIGDAGEALPGRHPRRPLGGQERGRHEAPSHDREPRRDLRQRDRAGRRDRRRRRQRRRAATSS